MYSVRSAKCKAAACSTEYEGAAHPLLACACLVYLLECCYSHCIILYTFASQEAKAGIVLRVVGGASEREKTACWLRLRQFYKGLQQRQVQVGVDDGARASAATAEREEETALRRRFYAGDSARRAGARLLCGNVRATYERVVQVRIIRAVTADKGLARRLVPLTSIKNRYSLVMGSRGMHPGWQPRGMLSGTVGYYREELPYSC